MSKDYLPNTGLEKLFVDYGVELLQLQDRYPSYESSTESERQVYDSKEIELHNVYVKAVKELINSKVIGEDEGGDVIYMKGYTDLKAQRNELRAELRKSVEEL